MKNFYIVSTFALMIGIAPVLASSQNYSDEELIIQARQKPFIQKEAIEEEKMLIQGISFLQQEDDDKALECFNSAIEKYSSPLGYLYASALEDDWQTAQRYFNMAVLAAKKAVIDPVIFYQHEYYLFGDLNG